MLCRSVRFQNGKPDHRMELEPHEKAVFHHQSLSPLIHILMKYDHIAVLNHILIPDYKMHNLKNILAQWCSESEWTGPCSHIASALDHMQLPHHAGWHSSGCCPSFFFHVAQTCAFSMDTFWWMLWKVGCTGTLGHSDFSMCSRFSKPGMPKHWPGVHLPFIFRMIALCQAQVTTTVQIHLEYMFNKLWWGNGMSYKYVRALMLKWLGFCLFSLSSDKNLLINKSHLSLVFVFTSGFYSALLVT